MNIQKKSRYSQRKYVIIALFCVIALIFLIKLFTLQIVNTSYKITSENNVFRRVTQYPARGKVFDRNGNLLIYNEASYDLMVIPKQVKKAIDTTKFCSLLNIDKEFFISQMKKCKKYSNYRPSIFIQQISKEDYGHIVEILYQYPGFYFQTRTLRRYPESTAAHLLGDVGEVGKKLIESNPYYKSGDYVGLSGIERYYEEILRGKKGLKIMLVDVHNREKGSYENGAYDTLPVTGTDLYLGIDIELQKYGEQLMNHKTGSIVAIEPSTGQILAMVNSPTYDPNLLVGRERGKNYNLLVNAPHKPLINRAANGTYPPGSTFKMINALVCLQSGTLTENTTFTCQGVRSLPIKCTHSHQSPLALKVAIENSCNPFFWFAFRNLLNSSKFGDLKDAYEFWYQTIWKLGLGHTFNTDIPAEVSGNIPSRAYFDKVYNGKWNAMTVRSLSIGQGEILITPLQMANLAAVIGNEGFYYPPHLLRQIADSSLNTEDFLPKRVESGIEAHHFHIVKEAMREVFEGDHGTARYSRIDSISAAGKTGTAQNPHGKDHSIFMAFAPVEKPQIAIAVVVENAGFGSTYAAPIASLMIEKYIKGYTTRKHIESRIMEVHFNE